MRNQQKESRLIESKTNHDVKAVEYFIREEMNKFSNLKNTNIWFILH